MTTQAQHTPVPWHYWERNDSRKYVIADSEATEAGRMPLGTNMIADVVPVSTGNHHEANAAFIVRACNAHDEMLTACRARLNEWHKNVSNMEKKEPESVKLSRSAIVAATKD